MERKSANQEMKENLPSITDGINTKEFHTKINELQEFSKSIPSDSNLSPVPISGGLFGWFDHKVTGDELNVLTQEIQNKMIAQNKELVKLIKEFGTIYKTFEELDKGYIQGIIASLKSAEEANRKALEGIDGVEKNNRKIEKDQKKIEGLMKTQKTAVEVLQSFKEKLDKMEHILDVDQLFSDVDRLNTELSSLQQQIEKSNKESKKIVNQKILQVENTVEKGHSSMQEKITSVIKNQKSENQNIRELIHKNSQKNDASLNDVSKQLASHDDEIKSVNQSVSELTQQLKITRLVVAGGFGILLIIMILILSGVL